MTTVNIHEAKTHLSRLVDRAARGEPFVIAKAGTPLVRVCAIDAPATPQRLGFLEGDLRVPDDFNEMGAEVIAALFTGVAPPTDTHDDAPAATRPHRVARGRRTP